MLWVPLRRNNARFPAACRCGLRELTKQYRADAILDEELADQVEVEAERKALDEEAFWAGIKRGGGSHSAEVENILRSDLRQGTLLSEPARRLVGEALREALTATQDQAQAATLRNLISRLSGLTLGEAAAQLHALKGLAPAAAQAFLDYYYTQRAVGTGQVQGREGTKAHQYLTSLINAVGLRTVNIRLYSSEERETMLHELIYASPEAYEAYLQAEKQRQVPASVMFARGEAFVYYDAQLNDDELATALGHEFGHIVLRSMLHAERVHDTPLWGRLQEAYTQSGSPENFVEWFAGEAAKWSRQERTPRTILEALYGKFIKLVKRIIQWTTGEADVPNAAVTAYLDALVLREQQITEQQFRDMLASGTSYDLLTFQAAYYHGQRSELVVSDTIDFLTPGEVGNKTLGQVRNLFEAAKQHSKLVKGAAEVGEMLGEVGGRTLMAADSYLRSRGVASYAILADIFNDAARPEQGRKAGPQVLTFKDQRGRTHQHTLTVPTESWRAAVNRLTQRFARKEGGLHDLMDTIRQDGKIDPAAMETYADLLYEGKADQSAFTQGVRAYLDGLYEYASSRMLGGSGTVHLGHLKDYVPRYYDPERIKGQYDQFVQDVMQYEGYSEASARELAINIASGNLAVEAGGEDDNQLPFYSPGAKAFQHRTLRNMPAEVIKKYLIKDVEQILTSYTHQMIKRVEFEARTGMEYQDRSVKKDHPQRFLWRSGFAVNFLLNRAKAEAIEKGYSPEQVKVMDQEVRQILEAYLGRLGATIAPTTRNVMSTILAGMNTVLLPLSLLAQFTDIASPLMRTNNDMKSAWQGFNEALKAAFTRDKDHNLLWRAAEAQGVVYRAMADQYASGQFEAPWITQFAKKWNDKIFSVFMIQQWTNFARLYAWRTSYHWLTSLASRNDEEAARWLQELNLTLEDVRDWVGRGQPEWNAAQEPRSASEGIDQRVAVARMRFVQESVFMPDASQRPAWASSPYFALVWHLKQYSWSFAKQVLLPTVRELMKNPRWGGKLAVMMAMFMLIPLASLGLGLRDWLRYGLFPWREEPAYLTNPDSEWDGMYRAMARTGVLGPMQLLLDAGQQAEWGHLAVASLMGPTVSKVEQAFLSENKADWALGMVPGLSMLPEERKLLLNWGGGGGN